MHQLLLYSSISESNAAVPKFFIVPLTWTPFLFDCLFAYVSRYDDQDRHEGWGLVVFFPQAPRRLGRQGRHLLRALTQVVTALRMIEFVCLNYDMRRQIKIYR